MYPTSNIVIKAEGLKIKLCRSCHAESIVRLASSEEGAEEEEHQAEEGVHSRQDVLDEVDQQMSPMDLLHQFSPLSGNSVGKIGLNLREN